MLENQQTGELVPETITDVYDLGYDHGWPGPGLSDSEQAAEQHIAGLEAVARDGVAAQLESILETLEDVDPDDIRAWLRIRLNQIRSGK